MQLEGVTGAPYKTPRIQKRLPAPFQRPSISVGGTTVKRSWKLTPVTDISPGDMVANFGKVDRKQQWFQRDPYEWSVNLINVVGDEKRFGGHETVFAFTPER